MDELLFLGFIAPRRLPIASGIYVLLHRRCVVYVGQSVNLRARIPRHRAKPHDSVMILRCEASRLRDVEAYLIGRLDPSLNVIRP